MGRQQYHHILKPNDDLNMPDNFIFFDTETHIIKTEDKKEKQTLKLGWLRHVCFSRKEDEYFYFDTPKDFWDYVEANTYDNLIIIAHNVDFDFRIVDGLNEMHIKRGWKYGKSYIEGCTYILDMHKRKEKIKIYDSMNYAQKSLEEIGKSMNIPKMPKPDFETCTMEELSIYCRNDVLVLSEFMVKLVDFLRDNQLTKLMPTSASCSFNAFRHKYYDMKNNPIDIHAYPELTKVERASYKGGICDCFKVGKFDDKLVKLDINSMYPFVYRNNPAPIKALPSEENIDEMRLGELLDDYHVIADCTITLKEEYAYILTHGKVKRSQKCLFIKGTFDGYYTTPELEFILKYGKIEKIREAYIYEKKRIFTQFVDDLYGLRLKYEAEGNKLFADFCKMLLNSLYGKWGAYDIDDIEIKRKDGKEFDMDMSSKMIRTIDGNFTVLHVGNTMRIMRKSDRNAFESFPAISSFITAYARMYLIEMILKVGRENVYYMDTDCIIIKAEKMHLIKEYIDEIIGHKEDGTPIWKKELGKLKIEGYSNVSEFIRPKNYMFDGDIKCKGVKKDVFALGEKKKDIRNRIVSDDANFMKIEQVHFERHKTAMKKGNLNNVMVSIVSKKISKLYDKGRIINNNVHPFDASEVTLCTTLNRPRPE